MTTLTRNVELGLGGLVLHPTAVDALVLLGALVHAQHSLRAARREEILRVVDINRLKKQAQPSFIFRAKKRSSQASAAAAIGWKKARVCVLLCKC